MGGADPALASLMETMMAQLLSKEVLYEPIQAIAKRVRSLPGVPPSETPSFLTLPASSSPAGWWRSVAD